MSRSVSDFLRHILEEADYLAEAASELSQEDFLADQTVQRAFVRSIEIVGEAAKKLPRDWRATHPDVDWGAMAGMRDRLIHGHFGVDYEIVWEVASRRLPQLRSAIARLIEAESDG